MQFVIVKIAHVALHYPCSTMGKKYEQKAETKKDHASSGQSPLA